MDEFAQSRADDDLFDDDIIPIEPTKENAGVETIAKKVRDISLKNAPKGPAAETNHHRANDPRGGRSRGRGGRGRGVDRADSGQPSSSLLQSKYAHAPAPAPIDPDPAPLATSPAAIPSDVPKSADGEPEPASEPVDGPEDKGAPSPVPTTEPITPARPPAVRGDRTATGGIKKPKLTEEELTAKLAAAKTRSENRSAAHARAEADAASFNERERAAAEKRVKDAANRKVMEGEREKNRARKMAVMGGREWDAEKNEDDFKMASRGRGRGNYVRGANGGVRASHEEIQDEDLRQYQRRDNRGGGRGRGKRGGRGSEHGAAGGRAGRGNGAAGQPDITADVDFPSLPATTKPRDDTSTARRQQPNKTSSEVISPIAGAGSWADQVEVSEAAKPKGGC
ncbi:hypothetical protein EPUS_09017 [Endocarpon pusillum Z07020]|uniref:Uncharacterized protein n=1 Tax=Endocarpon pusillum (strain Z07020 / HMAS-L-300199) TaxID=1263415 RepID=U1GWR9_ENDPU|nr:uncharacterized protein EPUS_09017 [Endocarpon pusillum Z07020]ERF76536.1 hypothetical protein EPUS_09017 [Endocarpon pusillum Z07020]